MGLQLPTGALSPSGQKGRGCPRSLRSIRSSSVSFRTVPLCHLVSCAASHHSSSSLKMYLQQAEIRGRVLPATPSSQQFLARTLALTVQPSARHRSQPNTEARLCSTTSLPCLLSLPCRDNVLTSEEVSDLGCSFSLSG